MWRLRADMIAVFQDLKRVRGRSSLEIRRNFLMVRTIKQWNSLPPDVVGAPSLEVFKKRLDSHLSGMV